MNDFSPGAISSSGVRLRRNFFNDEVVNSNRTVALNWSSL